MLLIVFVAVRLPKNVRFGFFRLRFQIFGEFCMAPTFISLRCDLEVSARVTQGTSQFFLISE